MTPEQLLPQVYDELRRLAASKMQRESPDHSLNATALVHEAFLKLGAEQSFSCKSDFLRAAAVAMRRILVDHARARLTLKRGGDRQQLPLGQLTAPLTDDVLVALDEALNRLREVDSTSANLVELKYFSGLTLAEAAVALGISPRSADRLWSFARAWLFQQLSRNEEGF